MPFTAQDVRQAASRIQDHVRKTPVERAPYLETITGGQVYLKLENLQVTGSFKVRGATHKLTCLSETERARGVIAASSGNHGVAVAHSAHRLHCPATVYVPSVAAQTKIATMRGLGAEVIVFGDDCVIAEAEARRVAEERGVPYISPYNDAQVAAGQGVIGVELAEQTPPLDALFVSLGGGGLVSGIATYLAREWPALHVVACSPERSPAMHACLAAGEIVDVPCHDTLSDGTAGGVEKGAITFETCRDLIDESLLVSEDEIRAAMRSFIKHQHQLLEGAAGVALAGLVQSAADQRWKDKRVGVVVCGTNIGMDALREVLR